MKKLLIMCLMLGIGFAESYKSRLNDNIEIIITDSGEWEITFEFKQDNKVLLSGKADDKYGRLVGGMEIDDDENGNAYGASEYYNVANGCISSFRIQNAPADENDKKKRLRIVANRDMGQQCKKYLELEDVIFFKQ